ncbi:MAG: sulfurtransferase [Pseudomonadota bacterium]
MRAHDPLITAAELQTQISAANVRVLDATWVPTFLKDRPNGYTYYLGGHLPGAVFFDIDEIADQSSDLPHMLPPEDAFAEAVGQLGVSNQDEIIVYDSNGFFASARAWWMFRVMGHEHVRVLDGGLKAWQDHGGDLEASQQTPAPANFTAKLNRALLKDMNEMRAHILARDIAILDARAQGRFDGSSPEPRPELPSGHMPGSSCMPATDLISSDGTLKAPADLATMLAQYAETDVVTTCGSGVSAAIISLALARLGNWNAALYDGSWSEWAAHSDNSIATIS